MVTPTLVAGLHPIQTDLEVCRSPMAGPLETPLKGAAYTHSEKMYVLLGLLFVNNASGPVFSKQPLINGHCEVIQCTNDLGAHSIFLPDLGKDG